MKQLEIPSHVNYLDHWLYELRRIYDDIDENKPSDWLTNKKD